MAGGRRNRYKSRRTWLCWIKSRIEKITSFCCFFLLEPFELYMMSNHIEEILEFSGKESQSLRAAYGTNELGECGLKVKKVLFSLYRIGTFGRVQFERLYA